MPIKGALLTELLEHFVALVEDEVLEVLEVELLAPDQRQDPAGSADDDVRAVGLEHLLVLGDRQAAEKHSGLERKMQRLVNLAICSSNFIA